MSTHAALGITKNGKTKVTYVHSDGYPSWVGVEVVEFCKRVTLENKWSEFSKAVGKLRSVNSDNKPSNKKWFNYYKDSHCSAVSNHTDWYAVLRNLQGAPTLDAILSGHLKHWMETGKAWLQESHYGYVINLDEHHFEFWYDGEIKFSSSLDTMNISWKKD